MAGDLPSSLKLLTKFNASQNYAYGRVFNMETTAEG